MRTQNPKYDGRHDSSKYVKGPGNLKKENECLQNDIVGLIERGRSRGHSSQRKTTDNFNYTQPLRSGGLNDDTHKHNKDFFAEAKTETNFYSKTNQMSNTGDFLKTKEYESSRRYRKFPEENLDHDEKIHLKILGAKEDLEINKKNMGELKDAYRTLCRDNNNKQSHLEESLKEGEYMRNEITS